jgi:hypothetical protein
MERWILVRSAIEQRWILVRNAIEGGKSDRM